MSEQYLSPYQKAQAEKLAALWAAGELPAPTADPFRVETQQLTREPDGMSPVERKLWEANPDDFDFLRPYFRNLPDYLTRYFADRYVREYKQNGRRMANTFIRNRMGGELQRRIRLVMKRYQNLPTQSKALQISEDAEEALRNADIEYRHNPTGCTAPQISMNLDKAKNNAPRERILAELEQDEIADMAFKLAQAAQNQLHLLVHEGIDETEDETALRVYRELASFAESMGIPQPEHRKKLLPEHAQCGLLKLLDTKWWQRRLKKARALMREHLAIAMGQVSKSASTYCSRDCLSEYKEQQRKNWQYIEKSVLIDEDTEETVELSDMVLRSVANPAIRRHELMVRTRGCEDIANHLGLTGLFLTLTAPSKYHNTRKKGGFIENWNGASPRDAQSYLNAVWSRIRAQLARDDVRWFGVRVAEPHHDGTPHWHLLLWLTPENVAHARNVFIEYAIEDDTAELLPKKTKTREYVGPLDYRPRCDVKIIDPEKGTATGYIAKYISKNIDGFAMDQDKDDETGESIKETAKNVCAWKSRWSIRQFQFFGGAPVTTYRELRRYANIDKASFNEYLTTLSRKELIAIYNDHAMAADLHGPRLPASQLKTKDLFARISNVYQPTVEHQSGNVVQAMQSADTGDWMGYVMGQGGPFVKRKDLIIRNTYDVTPFGSPYGEAVSKIGGINAAGMEIKTRLRRFQIVPKSKVAQVADALSGGAAASRSSVNNCTPTSGDDFKERIRSEFVNIVGQAYELNDDNLSRLLKGQKIGVGNDTILKVAHQNGHVQLIQSDPPNDSDYLCRLDASLDDLPWMNDWPEI
jgi:hypothetical protein